MLGKLNKMSNFLNQQQFMATGSLAVVNEPKHAVPSQSFQGQ